MRTTGRSGHALTSAAAVTSARLTALVAAAVQLPILTRLLEPGDYGKLAVAIAVATYFNVFTDVHTLALQRFPGNPGDRSNYAYAAKRTYGTVAVIAGVLIVGGYLFGGSWQYALAIAGWGFGVTASRFVATAWLGWLKPWSYAGSLTTSTVVRTAVLVALVATTGDADVSLAVAGAACGVAALLTGPRLIPRRTAPGQRPWRLGFGIQLAVTSAAVTLMGTAVLLVLPVIEAPDAVGRFAATFQLAALTSGSALGLLTTVAYPRLRHAWDAGRQEDVHTALVDTALLIVTTCAAVLAVTSAGDYWLARLAVAEGLRDFRLLPVLIVATAVASLATTTSWEHQFRLEVASLSRRTLAAAVVGTALMAYLALQFGLTGAAAGVVVLRGTYALLVAPGTRRPLRVVVTTVALGAVGIAALVVEPSSFVVTAVGTVGAAVAGAVLLRRLHARKV
ncbi:lipopolysaccharide biosynthesis protein [Georgenia sp. H159]|uniref:lipopolysaccharide biosynthesis protein n=1 Tax=Georgenia sp. H159 TaxID=3076115 RepID=UPI002D784DA2|nr:oligosaccharide flippase family protein [Georgenia sp. H159]